MNKSSDGFTIVELLVVIIVIGILAAVTIVSYTGINGRANVALLKSDLSSSATQLKMYYAEKGSYPTQMAYDTNGNFCPTPTDGKYCLKPSAGNSYSYESPLPYTFALIASRTGTRSYVVTHDTGPIAVPIITLGGTITQVGGNRVHTFSPGSQSVNITYSGVITVELLGAGGGGGGNGCSYGNPCTGPTGGGGGESNVQYPSGTFYRAYGGAGGTGGDGDCDCGGSDGGAGGTAYPAGFTPSLNVSGGGGIGGSGQTSSYGAYGGSGGAGGQLKGTISVTSGTSLSINAGLKGTSSGGQAGDGVVVISYPY
jgi:prepilin-type N-terminal cleavage/methylation domain-containing protein